MRDTWVYKQNTIPSAVTLLTADSPYSAIVPSPHTVGAFATGNSTWATADSQYQGHINANQAIALGELGITTTWDASAPFLRGEGVARTVHNKDLGESTLLAQNSGLFQGVGMGNKTLAAPATAAMQMPTHGAAATMTRGQLSPMLISQVIYSPLPAQPGYQAMRFY